MKLNFKKEILIALLPAFGYLTAYNYEFGYLSSFNLPETLIQIKLEQLVSFTVLFSIFVFVVIGVMEFIYNFYHLGSNQPIARNIIKITWPFMVGAFIAWYFDIPDFNKYLPLFLGLIIFSIAIYFVLSLFPTKENKKYTLRERLSLDKKSNHKTPSVLDVVPFSREIDLILILITTLSFFSQAIGKKAGLSTNKYIVFRYHENEYAMIRDYGDKKVAVKVVQGKFTDEYILVQSSDNLMFGVKSLSHPSNK